MRNWNKLYQTYLKNYQKRKDKSIVGMEEKYTFFEFQAMYTALENDRKLEIKKGTRKVANITQDLIAKQELYSYSVKQAKELRKALKVKFGQDFKLKDIRMGLLNEDAEFWNYIKEFKEGLIKQGVSRKETREIISSTFFGS